VVSEQSIVKLKLSIDKY